MFSNNTGNIYGLWFFSINDINTFKDGIAKIPSKKIDNISIMDKLSSAKVIQQNEKKIVSNPLNNIFDRIDIKFAKSNISNFISSINSILKEDINLAESLREEFLNYKKL